MKHAVLATQKKCKILPVDYLYPKPHSGSNTQTKTHQQTFSSLLTQIYLHSFLQNELGIAFWLVCVDRICTLQLLQNLNLFIKFRSRPKDIWALYSEITASVNLTEAMTDLTCGKACSFASVAEKDYVSNAEFLKACCELLI